MMQQPIDLPFHELLPITELVSNKHHDIPLVSKDKQIADYSVKIEKDNAICKQLWNEFSPNNSLFDVWEYRIASNQVYNYPLAFITIYYKSQAVALIPLWYSPDEKRYEWVGGEYPEDNLFFTKQKELLPLILDILPSPIKLTAVLPESLSDDVRNRFTEDEEKYMIDLSKYQSFDALLATYKKKYRYNLKRSYRTIDAMQPELIQVTTLAEYKQYMEPLKEFSRERFHGEGDFKSIFIDEREVQSFIEMFKNQGIYKLWMQVIKIQNKVAVVDVIASYNNIYYMLSGANDIWSFPGVGFYANYIEMQDAYNRKAVVLDALQGDCGWKRHFFTLKNLVKFEKE